MGKIRTIDLFAGCGGLTEGFEQTGLYDTLACVEWEKAQCDNLVKRLSEKWGVHDAQKRVIRFDIQRTGELINGFDDPCYGKSEGLDKLVNGQLDLVIGGPPCQAYSIAGRIRDEHGMKNDYRNYLFESYLRIVKYFRPKAFVFENVPGILSAKPGDIPIVELIQREFRDAGYDIIPNLRDAVVNMAEYGVPQVRKRVIILGLNREVYGEKSASILWQFYNFILPSLKTQKSNLREAIGDLPKLLPFNAVDASEKKKVSHTSSERQVLNHVPRYHNDRDIEIFRLLAEDCNNNSNLYTSVEARKELYTKKTGYVSNIHKYHVLKWDEPSTTIPAHLCKDGLRHIHPDPEQARTITVREAARIQTFPDDFEFIGAMTDQYKMIGNAVPPKFAKILAEAINDVIGL